MVRYESYSIEEYYIAKHANSVDSAFSPVLYGFIVKGEKNLQLAKTTSEI